MNRPTPVQFAWVVFCLVAMSGILLTRDPLRTDFRPFYYSAEAWRDGAASLYPDTARPNLNPPWLALVLSPLSRLSMRAAFLVWSAVGAMFVAASLVVIVRALHMPVGRRFWIAGAMLAAMPCAMVWGQGQVTWFLLFPVTCAWVSSRSSAVAAGLWLAPAIALKPQLLLLLLFLPVPTSAIAAAGALSLNLAAVIVMGLAPWREWLLLSRKVIWLGHPENGSLWAPIARAVQGDLRGLPIFGLPIALIAAVVVLAVVTGIAVRRVSDVDRRWVLAMTWTTMFSPLGWIYYLPLVVGPVIASWPRSVAAMVSLGLLCMPIQILWTQVEGLRSASVVAAIYPIGVVVMFLAWLSSPARQPVDHPRGHQPDQNSGGHVERIVVSE